MRSLLVAIILLVPLCYGADDRALPALCLKEYKKVVGHYGTNEGHCTRLQLIVNCFSRHRDASSDTLDKMRYLFCQEAIFVNKLGNCHIDYDDLKEIVDKTGLAKKHKYLDSVDDDHWEACALEVHKTCIKKYLSEMSHDHEICKGARDWIACYNKEAQRQGCAAKILKHFTHMLEIVGNAVVKAIQISMGKECLRG